MTKYKGVRTLEVLEGAENYNKWIAQRVYKYVKSPALEIGAGTGNISSYFADLDELVLTDIDSKLVVKLKQKFGDKKNIEVEEFNISARLGNVKKLYKTIFSVNVLEHIVDDDIALKNMFKLLIPSGRVVILVPAKKFAYKKLDKNLGHFRRYEKEELAGKIMAAGFKIEEIEYFNILGLLSWLVRDKISSKDNHLKPSQVRTFDLLVPILKMIEPKKGLPLGISLVAIGSKVVE